MKDFQELVVWQKSHALTLEVYRATKAFPRDELYGLTSQMRRSAASVPTNIAEGCGRRSGDVEFKRFLEIALGSATELEYQLILAHDLAYISKDDHRHLSSLLTESKRMLVSLIQKLNPTQKLAARS
ncbi:MAG: four helix bundle protein [Pleurocapsa sp. SU_196_0]|nr:four helix bundle protein [Pleurocapsa sp. SU_196_0]